MVPAGYLLKHVKPPPDWLVGAPVEQVCSVASCMSENVVDPSNEWLHNGFGVANDPGVLTQLLEKEGADPEGAKLFYYEVFEEEIDSDGWTFDRDAWQPLSLAASSSVPVDVSVPPPDLERQLLGYDVVTFGDFLEHSPLSCNSVAKDLQVNKYCLFNTLDEAKRAIDSGGFGGGSEEGVYKIFSVTLLSARTEP